MPCDQKEAHDGANHSKIGKVLYRLVLHMESRGCSLATFAAKKGKIPMKASKVAVTMGVVGGLAVAAAGDLLAVPARSNAVSIKAAPAAKSLGAWGRAWGRALEQKTPSR